MPVFIIFLKELKETIRDRRTLVFMLVLPTLAVPALIWSTVKIGQYVTGKQKSQILQIALYGEEYWPELRQYFDDPKQFTIREDIQRESMIKSIRNEDLDAAIIVPPTFQERLKGSGQAEVEIVINDSGHISITYDRLKNPLEVYSRQVRSERLKNLGISNSLEEDAMLNPVNIRKTSLATQRERMGSTIGGFLPYIFIIFTFMGALYPAMDLGAGEKERMTLETLLLAPVERTRLVLGKYLVVTLTGLISAVMAIISISISFFFMFRGSPGELGGGENAVIDFIRTIGVTDLLLIGSLILPMSAIFGAALLSVSIYAKTFKEAQNYIAPLSYTIILPAILSLIPGIELTLSTALVPILNISLASREILKGTLDSFYYVLIMFSTIGIAALALFFCNRWFQKEDVLFRG